QLDRPPKLGILVGQFSTCLTRAELEQAESHAAQIRRLGEHGNGTRWKRTACEVSGCVCLYLGRFMDARDHYENWLLLRGPTDQGRASENAADVWYVLSMVYFSRSLLCLGHIDQARAWRSEAMAEARRRSPFEVAFAQCHASFDGWLIEGMKSAPGMLRSAEEISTISREYGFPVYVGVGDILRGFCVAAM